MSHKERFTWVVLAASVALQVSGKHKPHIVPHAGAVHAILAHETGDDNKDTGKVWTTLRTGVFDEYFAQPNHQLDILDDDIKDEKGVRIIPETDLAEVKLPVILLYDKNRKLVAKIPLTAGATPQSVVDVIRSYEK